MSRLNTVALVVEGETDVPIYQLLVNRLDKKGIRLDIVIGESKSNIISRHNSNEFKFNYIIVLDSDLDRYLSLTIDDGKIIYTHGYSVENYLVYQNELNTLCYCISESLARKTKEDSNLEDTILPKMNAIFDEISKIILYKCSIESQVKFEDSSPEQYFESKSLTIKSDTGNEELNGLINSALIDESIKEKVESIVGCDIIIPGKHKLRLVLMVFQYYYEPSLCISNIRDFQNYLTHGLTNSRMFSKFQDKIEECYHKLNLNQ